MLSLKRLEELPDNFQEYVAEVADGLSALYGSEAAAEYRQKAPRAVRQAIQSPAVDAIALLERDKVAGFLLAAYRGAAAHISFVHVLAKYAHRDVETRLVEEAVRTLRAGGVEAIVSEFVPLGEIDLGKVYKKLGFETIPRLLMVKELDKASLAGPVDSTPCAARAFSDVANVIVDAYDGHPERRLHLDVRTAESAIAFVKAASAGSYGPSRREYVRGISRESELAGVIVGCQAAPGLGFVLQVAVRRRFQNGGIGSRLLEELAHVCAAAGLTRIGLGVTMGNPAKALYERLGFVPLRQVDAYVWWRPSEG